MSSHLVRDSPYSTSTITSLEISVYFGYNTFFCMTIILFWTFPPQILGVSVSYHGEYTNLVHHTMQGTKLTFFIVINDYLFFLDKTICNDLHILKPMGRGFLTV